MFRDKSATIVLADDDSDDCMLVQEALQICSTGESLYCLSDGEELLNYLYRRDRYTDPASSPRPDLILLDLNMPRKDGFEAIQEIKGAPVLRCIPLIVFSTSTSEADVSRAYSLGANSFITKPVRFASLVDIMETLGKYWLSMVKLPESRQSHECN